MLLCCLSDAVLERGREIRGTERDACCLWGRERGERGGMINKESAMIGGKTQDNLRRAIERWCEHVDAIDVLH